MNKEKTLNRLLLIVLLLGIFAVFIHYSLQKSGMFIDEIYSYGLSNSDYAPFITDIKENGINEKVLTQQDFQDYLSVQSNQRFDYASVYYNQTRDVHPPLYYFLLHTVSSFFPENASKWIGLALNSALFVLTILSLYALISKLYGKPVLAWLGSALYGLSTIAISTALMIRMYMLLTLMTLLLANSVIGLIRSQQHVKYCLFIFITIFLGMMTQYYFVFYAFFVSVAVDVYLLCRKRYKVFFAISASALLGVIVMVAAYPACINHMFADQQVSGISVIQTAKDIASYSSKLKRYLYSYHYSARVIDKAAEAFLLLAIITSFWTLRCEKEKRCLDSLILIIPAILSFVVIVIASPMLPLRYVYNLAPLFVCGVCFLVNWVLCAMPETKMVSIGAFGISGIIAAYSLVVALSVAPEFLYPEQSEYTSIAMNYSEVPCVYFDDGKYAPMTQDMLQLREYNSVFVTDDEESAQLRKYLNDENSVVVYIDTNDDLRYFSGLNADEILEALCSEYGYVSEKALYEFGGTEVYVLSK